MATGDAHKNFAYSNVATAPSPATSGTSLVVTAGHGARFPAVPFNATIWPISDRPTPANAELVRVTGRSTDTLTIVRAQESSSARTVIVGDQIAATISAKSLTDIETAIDAIYEAAAGPGLTISDDVPTTTTTFEVPNLKIDMLTTPGAGVWTQPANALWHEILVIAGGGGGGSGQRVANNLVNAQGGSGGGPGGIARVWVSADQFGATEDYVVGTGGTGGAAQAGTSNGQNGTAGTNSTFGTDLDVIAAGGLGGNGGVSGLTGIGGLGGTGNMTPDGMVAIPNQSGGVAALSGRKGGRGSGGANVATGGSSDSVGPGAGGGAGGAGNAGVLLQIAQPGGAGTTSSGIFFSASAGGAVTNALSGTDGNPGASCTVTGGGQLTIGGGGGSGGNGTVVAATDGGDGGDGGDYGGGGGGGGNGAASTSGAGGDGGDGVIVIITYIGGGA